MGNHHKRLVELPAGALKQAQHVGAGLAVQVASGFISQDNGRFGYQGAGNRHALLLAAGKVVGHILEFVLKAQHLHDLNHEFLIHGVAIQFHRQNNVLMHIQNRHQIVVLEHKPNVAAAEDGKLLVVHLGQFLVPNHHAAGSGSIQTAHHVQQGGFAGTGCTHHRYKLSFLYGEGHTVQSAGNVRLSTVIFFQIIGLQDTHMNTAFLFFDKSSLKLNCYRNVLNALWFWTELLQF